MPLDGVEPGGEVTGVHHSLDYLLRSILGGGCQQLTARVLFLSGLPEPDLAFSCGTLPGLTTSGKKLSSSMNKDSSLSLLHWTTPVGSLLNSSLLGSPFKHPVHPPPSTAPTSENPGPSYHPGTPSSVTRVNNYLVSLLPTLWRLILSTHWFPGSSSPARFTAL
ncbi:hypothetical protein AMECASPLE_015909 [Ameca splendens]|uniref:Uncharacterized protein n=1 Tax=Ameca splendens TaxID=208324 RepID=A0ABV0YQB7_9TELE